MKEYATIKERDNVPKLVPKISYRENGEKSFVKISFMDIRTKREDVHDFLAIGSEKSEKVLTILKDCYETTEPKSIKSLGFFFIRKRMFNHKNKCEAWLKNLKKTFDSVGQ